MSQAQAASTSGYLHTDGAKIVDADGKAIWLSGLNWFGFETANNAPHGLWSRGLEDMLDQIQSLGYNCLRIPFSNAMLQKGVMPTGIDYGKNPALKGLTALEVLDRLVAEAGKRGLWVILDNHRSTPGGGPEGGGLWYTSAFPESQWIADWKMLAGRYKGNPTVVGMDLRNEPYGGCWGCGEAATDWRMAAEKAGNAILAINPDLLILVEGVSTYNGQSTWWGGNLMGAKEFPVRLSVPNRLVYSPHEYPASVAYQEWFGDPTFPNNLPAIWDRSWGYLVKGNTAPLLIGEFGTRYEQAKDRQWLQALQVYIKAQGLSWTYWSLNPNSGDTGGLLLDDWQSVDQRKQAILAEIQFHGNAGILPQFTPTTRPQPKSEGSVGLPLVQKGFWGNDIGDWKVFQGGGSSVEAGREGSLLRGGEALHVRYTIMAGGWGGVEQQFARPQDWSKKTAFTFRLAGKGTGNPIRVEILDNRAAGSKVDSAERFETVIIDDFTGWKEFRLPWSAFYRRADWQPAGAPDDGFNRTAVWGFNFSPVSGEGEFEVEVNP